MFLSGALTSNAWDSDKSLRNSRLRITSVSLIPITRGWWYASAGVAPVATQHLAGDGTHVRGQGSRKIQGKGKIEGSTAKPTEIAETFLVPATAGMYIADLQKNGECFAYRSCWTLLEGHYSGVLSEILHTCVHRTKYYSRKNVRHLEK